MKELFDELKRDSMAAVDRLLAERREEGVQLEFKRKANPQSHELDRTDKHNLAQSVSAFANSAGGVVIWGVKTVDNKAGAMPYADGLLPITNIAGFQVVVDRVLLETVMPRTTVETHPIQSAANNGSGFLAMWVPRSERRPHHAELGLKAYFKRIGNRSMQMEHYDIEDAFKRAAVAQLDVIAVVRDGGSSNDQHGDFQYTDVDILLRNASSVSARFPYLKFESRPPGAIDYVGGADNVIHPGNEHHVCIIRLTAQRSVPQEGIRWVDPTDYMLGSTSITCTFGCLNSRRQWKGFRIHGRREVEELPVPADML